MTAPHLTLADIEGEIDREYYFTAEQGVHAAYAAPDGAVPAVPELGNITFCFLILKNGFKVVGANEGPVCPENFSTEKGRQYARENAVSQIWPLMGYALKDRLFNAAMQDRP